MSDFTYSGDETRYYPSLGLLVEPGDTVALADDPGDGRFALAGYRPFVPSVPDPAPQEPDVDDTTTPEVGA
jgi:hypothetical protein